MNPYMLMAAGLLILGGSVVLGTALVLISIELFRKERLNLIIIGAAVLLIGLAIVGVAIQNAQAAAVSHLIY